MSKSITCCELLEVWNRFYQKKMGVDGLLLFEEHETNEELFYYNQLTVSILKYFQKKEKLCEECQREKEKLLKGDGY